MDFSILLAILGLSVATVSLLSHQTKLSISFKLTKFDVLIFSLSLLLIHYIAFIPTLKELGLLIPLGPWRWGFDAKSTTYSIFLLLTIFTLLRIKYAKLTKENIDRFNQLAEELLFEEKYADITSLMERHSKELFKLIEENENTSRNLVSRLFSSKAFINYIASAKPYFGLELLKRDFSIKEQYVTSFLSSLIDNKGSLFYYEMENIQNIVTMHRFAIPEEYKLSHYLFSDIQISEKLAIYKPIGDKTIDLLSEDKVLIERNNSSLGKFYDNERKSSAIECSLHFFEIMILESLHQKLTWHMWLYYFPIFSKNIINQLTPSADVDLDKEWPTPFHYYLYRIIDINFDWIDEFQYVDGCEDMSFNNESLQHDNGSILKSAILSIGQIIWQVIKSSKFDDKFKIYCLDITLRHLRNFKEIEVLKPSYRVLCKSVLLNGFMNKKDLEVLKDFQELVNKVDHVLLRENEEFIQLLNDTVDAL
jgi:hypothetical protein